MTASLRFLCASAFLAMCGVASLIVGRWNRPLPAGFYFLIALICLVLATLLGNRFGRRSVLGVGFVLALFVAYLWWDRPNESCFEAQLRNPVTVCVYAANAS